MDFLRKLPEITARIVKTSDPEKIILFGSHARGDASEDSDLDLLVIVDGVQGLRAESIRMRRALRGLLVPVDLVLASSEQIERLGNEKSFVYHNALTEGRVLYERAF